MTDMQDQIPSTVSDSDAKQPVVRCVLMYVLLYFAYWLALGWLAYTIDPFVRGWDECIIQILVRLPLGLIAYRILKASRPVDDPRRIEKKRFRKFQLLYLFLIQLPIKYGSLWIAGASTPMQGQSTGAYLLNLFILAPFIEELILRGVFFNLCRKKLNFKTAALVNAAVFSFSHFGRPLTMVLTFLMALLFCALYEMTGSLRYGISLHFTFNILTIPLLFFARVVPPFIAIPMLVIAIVLHIILVIRKDKLEAMLFA